MMDFARTRMGAALLEGTIPRIAKALERIAAALEAQNGPSTPDNADLDTIIRHVKGMGLIIVAHGGPHPYVLACGELPDDDAPRHYTFTRIRSIAVGWTVGGHGTMLLSDCPLTDATTAVVYTPLTEKSEVQASAAAVRWAYLCKRAA